MARNKRAKEPSPSPGEACLAKPEESPLPGYVLAGAVTALVVLRPLYPSESAAVTGDGLTVVVMWLLILVLWAAFVARGSITRVRWGWPDIALTLLVLWHTIASLWAMAYESPRPALNMLWEWLGFAIAFFLARQAFTSQRQRRAVGAVMVALAIVVSIYGLYQYGFEFPATRQEYQQSTDERLREAGLWLPPGSPERQAFEQRLASLEPTATFALTNSLAGFLTPWTIVALAIPAAFARQLPHRQKFAVVILLIPLGLCLLLTKSRSAYLACGCGGAAVAAFWWIGDRTHVRLRRGLVTLGAITVLIAAVIGGAVSVGGLDIEVLSEAPKSLGYRLQYWQSSAAMIRDLPLMGCGPGNFQFRYTAYKLPEASEEIADPHNFLLEVWATAGTPALLALVAVGATSCLCLLRSPRRDGDKPETPITGSYREHKDTATIFLGAFVGMLLSIPVAILSAAPTFWAVPVVGVLVGGGTLMTMRPWVARGDDSPLFWALAAGVLLIHLLFAGGIAFPGVVGSLWLLLALALNTVRCGERAVGPRAGVVVLTVGLVLTAACYFTGYQPTLATRILIDRVSAGKGDPLDLLSKAAAADPWAIEPRSHLADAIYQQYSARPNTTETAEFDLAVGEALQRAPRSASLFHQYGVAYCELYRRNGSRHCLAKGIRLLESAVRLYPNDCRKRASLSEAYLLAGDRSGYQRQAAKALRLDQATPHLDKRLSEEQRHRLTRSIPAPDVRTPSPN